MLSLQNGIFLCSTLHSACYINYRATVSGNGHRKELWRQRPAEPRAADSELRCRQDVERKCCPRVADRSAVGFAVPEVPCDDLGGHCRACRRAVKVGPSARASRAPDGATLTARRSRALLRLGPGRGGRGRTLLAVASRSAAYHRREPVDQDGPRSRDGRRGPRNRSRRIPTIVMSPKRSRTVCGVGDECDRPLRRANGDAGWGSARQARKASVARVRRVRRVLYLTWK
jgi:hypothetical protein